MFNSLAINDSLISDNLKVLLLGLGIFQTPGVGSIDNSFCLRAFIADEKYLAKLCEIPRES